MYALAFIASYILRVFVLSGWYICLREYCFYEGMDVKHLQNSFLNMLLSHQCFPKLRHETGQKTKNCQNQTAQNFWVHAACPCWESNDSIEGHHMIRNMRKVWIFIMVHCYIIINADSVDKGKCIASVSCWYSYSWSQSTLSQMFYHISADCSA